MQYLLWFEGVDFSATLTDTNDLSTIRGSSFTLLDAFDDDPESGVPWRLLPKLYRAPGITEPRLVFSGASQGLFRFEGDQAAATAAVRVLQDFVATHGAEPEETPSSRPRKTLPLAHMRWVIGLAPIEGTGEAAEAAALRTAHFRARRAQMEDTAARRPAVPADKVCRISRSRPADTEIRMPADQAKDHGIDTSTSGEDETVPVPVSTSVRARKAVGRYARWRFHQDRLDWPRERREKFGFVDHFQQMIADPPDTPMREAVTGKLAVFYADGNEFTKIRSELGGGPDVFKRFSDKATTLQQAMLRRIVDDTLVRLADDDDPQVWRLAATDRLNDPDDDERRSRKRWLRFETLLYGGDEICWVAPAWLGMLLAARTFQAVVDAEIDGRPLTFKAGLVFAPVKMPIATARALAKDLADGVKSKSDPRTNRLGIHAFESVEPPMDGLAALRKRLVGDAKAFPEAHCALALDGDAFPALVEKISSLKWDGRLPRSQLYRLLRAAARTDVPTNEPPRPLGDPRAGTIAYKIFQKYRGGADADVGDKDLHVLGAVDPTLAAVNAWFLTHVWDYVDPTGDGRLDPARAPGRPA